MVEAYRNAFATFSRKVTRGEVEFPAWHGFLALIRQQLTRILANGQKCLSRNRLMSISGRLIPSIHRVKLMGLPSGVLARTAELGHTCQKIPIYSARPVHALVPEPIDAQFQENFAGQYFPPRAYPACDVMIIKNGVAHKNGFNMTSSGELIPDVCFEMGQWEEKSYSILKKPKLLPKVYTSSELVVSLTSPWHDNYFHWLFDILPRIHLVERSELSYSQIFADYSSRFQRETLSLLDIHGCQIISAREFDFVSSPTLIVPSLPGVPGIMPDWACLFLREQLKHKVLSRTVHKPRSHHRRLYVSRARASKRRIANEHELLPLLADFGFQVVQLEDYSFDEQVRLFSQAEIVVAPHGAGLANLVFCNEGTKVLEIHSPYWINACYFDLCRQVGLAYDYLIGEDIILDDETAKKTQTPDIRIEQSRLLKKLSALGVGIQSMLQS